MDVRGVRRRSCAASDDAHARRQTTLIRVSASADRGGRTSAARKQATLRRQDDAVTGPCSDAVTVDAAASDDAVYWPSLTSCTSTSRDAIAGRYCGTLLWEAITGRYCGTLLRDAIAGLCCGTLLRDAIAGRCCGTLLRDAVAGRYCRTLLRDAIAGRYGGTLLRHAIAALLSRNISPRLEGASGPATARNPTA